MRLPSAAAGLPTRSLRSLRAARVPGVRRLEFCLRYFELDHTDFSSIPRMERGLFTFMSSVIMLSRNSGLIPYALIMALDFRPRNYEELSVLSLIIATPLLRPGMSTSASELTKPTANNVRFEDECLVVDLEDGRSISVPVSWYPRLCNSTDEERSNWEIFGCTGIHWPDIDEDISVLALLAGKSSNESQSSLKQWLSSRKPSGS